MTALSVAAISRAGHEQALIAAVRRGDDRAFEELYRVYRSRIQAYVLGMVGDHGRAEDVTQEVFISALRRMRETARPIAFKPWIYEIAKNACIDQARRSRRRIEVPLESDSDGAAAGGDGEALLSEPGQRHLALSGAPDAAVLRKQELADLCGAFGGLSEAHHQVLVMRELEGRSYAEIGEQLGMTRPVVESTLFRARRKLGEEYDEIASGRRCEQVRTAIDARAGRRVRSLGTRERRRLARHLAYCQPCRRHAHLTGFDHSLLRAPSIAERVAALLPIPWLGRLLRGTGGSSRPRVPGVPGPVTSLQLADDLTRFVDSGVPAVMSRAAAAVVAVALAGVGTGVVTQTFSGSGGSSSGPVRAAPPTAPASAAAAAWAAAARAGGAQVIAGSRAVAPAVGAAARGGAGVGAAGRSGAVVPGVAGIGSVGASTQGAIGGGGAHGGQTAGGSSVPVGAGGLGGGSGIPTGGGVGAPGVTAAGGLGGQSLPSGGSAGPPSTSDLTGAAGSASGAAAGAGAGATQTAAGTGAGTTQTASTLGADATQTLSGAGSDLTGTASGMSNQGIAGAGATQTVAHAGAGATQTLSDAGANATSTLSGAGANAASTAQSTASGATKTAGSLAPGLPAGGS